MKFPKKICVTCGKEFEINRLKGSGGRTSGRGFGTSRKQANSINCSRKCIRDSKKRKELTALKERRNEKV